MMKKKDQTMILDSCIDRDEFEQTNNFSYNKQ